MIVKMTTSVATGFGAYNAGHEYDLSDAMAQEFLRCGWCEAVVPPSPVEAAILPTPDRPQQQTRYARGRPIQSR